MAAPTRLHESGPFQGSYGQPRETTQHLLGPIWSTFRPTTFKFHYVAPQFFIFRRTIQIAPNFLHWNAHIFLLLNPTGHSKFHNTSNHPPPTTDSGRTAHTPLYPPMQAVPPYSPHFTCPSLLWMCTLNTLTWPDLQLLNSLKSTTSDHIAYSRSYYYFWSELRSTTKTL